MKSTACISCNDFSEEDLDTRISITEDVVKSFFLKLLEETKRLDYSSERLLAVIEEFFTVKELSVPALSIFKSCLYRRQELFQSEEVIAAIQSALHSEKTFLCFSTKDLVQCILNTRNENLIKSFLNNLFCSSRDGTWSSLDTIAAIEYLIHRNMKHEDLKTVLKKENQIYFFFVRNFVSQILLKKPLQTMKKIG